MTKIPFRNELVYPLVTHSQDCCDGRLRHKATSQLANPHEFARILQHTAKALEFLSFVEAVEAVEAVVMANIVILAVSYL